MALAHVGQLDRGAGHLLDLGSQRGHLFAVACGGGCDLERRQMAQRVHRDVGFGAIAPFSPVVTSARSALGDPSARKEPKTLPGSARPALDHADTLRLNPGETE